MTQGTAGHVTGTHRHSLSPANATNVKTRSATTGHRLASLLAGLPFLIVAALALYLGIQRPFHNWDMIGYIAAVKAFDSSDAGEIHAYTYQSVRKAVPAEKYRELTELDHYRRQFFRVA